MPNTGRVVVLSLKEYQEPTHTLTGNQKPNVPSDGDYIAPYVDTAACPLTYTTDCPDYIYTWESPDVVYEFSLPNSVINNPAIKKVKVRLYDVTNSVEVDDDLHTLPVVTENYFTGTLTGATTGTSYQLIVEYLNNSNAVVSTCTGVSLTEV